jgi:hypothetical protein
VSRVLSLSPEQVARLRERLQQIGFTYDAVADRLGPTAHAALGRNETTPGLRATTDGSPVSTLTRLWLLQAPVLSDDADRALPGLVDPLCIAGVLDRSDELVRARVDLRPYAEGEGRDWWLVSDLTPGLDGGDARIGPDHVLGVSSASTSLAQLTVREPVGRALDLGTGCGVQSMHLSRHARDVVATDVNDRALAMARLNAALNQVDLDVRRGSLYDPVRAGETFDLVVTNPPFVISPGTGERLVYRDSGLPGDEMMRQVVVGGTPLLAPGGRLQVLGNWMHCHGEPWEERVGAWLDGTGCDAWVVQREVLDVAEYVELWLKDAGLHGAVDYQNRYDTWLAWFEQQQVEGIGFGWLNLRRTDRGEPAVRLEEWPFEVAKTLGAEVAGRQRRTEWLARASDADLLAARLVRPEDVRQETYGQPGAADPEQVVLRQQAGMRRARRVDTALGGLVGACDGELRVGQIVDALVTLLGGGVQDGQAVRLEEVRELVDDGFLEVPAISG